MYLVGCRVQEEGAGGGAGGGLRDVLTSHQRPYIIETMHSYTLPM